MPALELSVGGMNNTTYKYGYGIKFMSSDPDFDSHEYKWLAGIIPEATESYDSEQNGGMAIGFYTTANGDGFTFPKLRMKIGSDGSISADGIQTYTSQTYNTNIVEGDTEWNSVCSIDSTCQGNTISGGNVNAIFDYSLYGTIGGGHSNQIGTFYGTISGGYDNSVYAQYGAIGGGSGNESGGSYSAIGGGRTNEAEGDYSTIGGGYNNDATSSMATVSGGSTNYAQGVGSAVGGGYHNEASGSYTTIPGGYYNEATATYAFAAGKGAKANHMGTFVWNDLYDTCESDCMNQFKVCAAGGAWFSGEVSAQSFDDRTPYPENLDVAYEAVFSMQRLPDGQYDPEDISMQLDHASLSDFVKHVEANGETSRNLSATVSAQNEVIKHLIARTSLLEQRVATLEALLSSAR